MKALRRMLTYRLVCARVGHRWGPWRPAAEVFGPGPTPVGWEARECERGCGWIEMPRTRTP